MTAHELSPEVKAIMKNWVNFQKRKYGKDWKKKLAKEMTKQATPMIEFLTKGQK